MCGVCVCVCPSQQPAFFYVFFRFKTITNQEFVCFSWGFFVFSDQIVMKSLEGAEQGP